MLKYLSSIGLLTALNSFFVILTGDISHGREWLLMIY